ncbi:type II secretion system F family protein [Caenispirillum salinarum]|uniref:type II secretion system F family protein n=1 Tax=Caenispirillum salinarum TaxID=859058 RepID=UPI00384D9298
MDAIAAALADPTVLLTPEAGVLALVFAAVVLAVYGIAGLRSGVAARRFQRGGGRGARGAAGAPDDDVSLRPDGAFQKVEAFLKPYGETLEPQKVEERKRIRLTLLRAGFPQANAITIYYGLRLALAVLLPGLLVLALPVVSRQMEMSEILMLGAGLLALGFYIPSAVVALRVRERAWAVRAGFPDALDLMLVCVEAGMGLDAAINRVAEEIRLAHPVLSEHLRACALELRAGGAREDALRNLADRTGVEEVTAFSTLLIQSQELGTSIGDTLRVYSDDMRYRRMMAAEEKAQRLPAKMILPMAMFLLPAFVLVLMLPAAIRIMRSLFPTMEG